MPNLPTKIIRQKVTIPAEPSEVYWAYLDPKKASKFTGQSASGAARVGAKMNHGDGYITGKYLELVDGKKIVQEWVTTEWPEDYPPSILELRFEPKGRGTELTMIHSKVPKADAERYSEGWMEFYWAPLKAYFASAEKGKKPGRREASQ